MARAERLRGTAWGRGLIGVVRAARGVMRYGRDAVEDAYVGARFRRGGLQTVVWNGLTITETRHDPYARMVAFGRTAQLAREAAACRLLITDPAPVIFDVGANIGIVSLGVSAIPGATVYAFEPARAPFACLERNVAQNRRPNVIAVNCGLSDRAGDRFIGTPAPSQDPRYARRDAAKTGLFSVHALARGGAGERARFTTMDAFCAERGIDRISYVKIDVEGDEVACLAGGKSTLTRARPICQVEVNAFSLGIAGIGPRDVFASLHDLGYALFVFDGARFHPAPLEELARRPRVLEELYAVPDEAVRARGLA